MAFPSHRLVFALFLSVLNLQGAALSLDEASPGSTVARGGRCGG